MSRTLSLVHTTRTLARLIATTGFTTVALSMSAIHFPWPVFYFPKEDEQRR